jgi:hypothetical protein
MDKGAFFVMDPLEHLKLTNQLAQGLAKMNQELKNQQKILFDLVKRQNEMEARYFVKEHSNV